MQKLGESQKSEFACRATNPGWELVAFRVEDRLVWFGPLGNDQVDYFSSVQLKTAVTGALEVAITCKSNRKRSVPNDSATHLRPCLPITAL